MKAANPDFNNLNGNRYLFLNRHFEIYSDSPEALRGFDHVYARFKCGRAGGEESNSETIRLALLTAAQHSGSGACLWANGKAFSFAGEDLPAEIYFFVLNELFETVDDFFILHGSVVEIKGRAVIITGSSTAGKTTLAVALAGRGHAFLSDELAPIPRGGGPVVPFPRRIGIRRQGEFKELLDIEEIPGGRLGQACLPGSIFVLTPQSAATEDQNTRTVELAFNRIDENLLGALRIWPETHSVEVLAERYYPSVRITMEKNTQIVNRLDTVCREHNVFVVQYHDGRSEQPDFTASPECHEIQGLSAIIEVSKQILNGHPPSRLCQALNSSHSALMMTFAAALAHTRIFRITPGRLDELVKIVEDLTA